MKNEENQEHKKYKTKIMKLYNTKMYKHFFSIFVCEMEAMGLIKKNEGVL